MAHNELKIMVFAVLFLFLPGVLPAENAVLPIRIDYPRLQSMVESQLFNNVEKKIELMSDPEGCTKITISEPGFSEENSLLRFEIKVHIKSEFDFSGACYFPFEWEGYVVFYQLPAMTSQPSWTLSFETRDSHILNRNHEPEIITGTVWKFVRGNVHDFVDSIRIDFTPVVVEMKSFLADVFPAGLQAEAKKMTDSMSPGSIVIQNQAVQVGINTDVSSVYDPARTPAERSLSDTELDEFIRNWEAMDVFIVQMISTFINHSLEEDEKDLVLETLLETRYRFVAEIDVPVHGSDFVRNQFVAAWDSLSVIFKKYVGRNAVESPMESIAFLSSMDALKVLDSIGPAMGIEISRNGLIRLARLIGGKQVPDLFYSMETDENLRRLLGLGAQLIESSVQARGDHPYSPEDSGDPVWARISDFLKTTLWVFPSEAVADDQKQTEEIHLEKWVPNQPSTDEYVQKIRQILKTGTDQRVSKNNRDQEYADFFQLIMGAVAWQESCFRQFEEKNGKIQYLRSYNNTSVGIMQINERVWRGIYDLDKLRWNIHYNIDAGCEIADLYLNRYVYKKMEKKNYKSLENKDNIARTLYAIYNGGPGEFFKFLDRMSKEKFYQSDRLFYEKYLWTKNDQWENTRICLVGR